MRYVLVEMDDVTYKYLNKILGTELNTYNSTEEEYLRLQLIDHIRESIEKLRGKGIDIIDIK